MKFSKTKKNQSKPSNIFVALVHLLSLSKHALDDQK